MQEYLAQPSPLDESLTVLDFMREQLGGGVTDMQTISATVQGILDMAGEGLVAERAVLEEVRDCLLSGIWPPPCLDDSCLRAQSTPEKEEEEDRVLHLLVELVQNHTDTDTDPGMYTFSDEAQRSSVKFSLEIGAGKQGEVEAAEAARGMLFATAACVASLRPCRVALSGSGKTCSSTCLFDHQLHRFPCWYWLHSTCLREDCPFKHALEIGPNDSEGDNQVLHSEKTLPAVAYDEAFPELPGAAPAPADLTSSSSSVDVAAAAPLSGADDAARLLLGKFHLQARANPAATAPTSLDTRAAAARPLDRAARKNATAQIGEWIEGGKSVAELYATTREDAAHLARTRNALFEKGTALYRAGKRKEAKEVSSQGREVNEKLFAVQKAAAKKVFSARNSEAGLLKGNIDLHGLHVSEAKDCLRDLLPVLATARLEHISIITGSGNHTVGGDGQGRLLPAVEKYCNELGLPWQPIVVQGFAGGVLVNVTALIR